MRPDHLRSSTKGLFSKIMTFEMSAIVLVVGVIVIIVLAYIVNNPVGSTDAVKFESNGDITFLQTLRMLMGLTVAGDMNADTLHVEGTVFASDVCLEDPVTGTDTRCLSEYTAMITYLADAGLS